MKEALIVFAGGGLGAVARYLINRHLGTVQLQFPWATLTANVLSCLILGLVLGWLALRSGQSQLVRLLFITGFCGGLSTYSTFTLQSIELYKNVLIWLFFLNIIGNFILCVGAVSAGLYLARLSSRI
ncbi:MAG TPA: CrcB family protein [Anseongella sp.]